MAASETSVIGKAGELRVASELLLRGYLPLVASVDEGVDIALTNGVTIQVKTCRSPGERGRPGGRQRSYYVFTMHALRERGNGGKRVHRHHMVADYAVLWCVPDGFYIVPRKVLGERHTISVPAENRGGSQWDEWRDRWGILTLKEPD